MDARNLFPGAFNGFRTWSGNPPTSFLSGGDPALAPVFYGMNMKDNAGKLWYLVWSVAPNGVATERLKIGPDAGQGVLAVDAGHLVLTIFVRSGDGQATQRMVVPGWIKV